MLAGALALGLQVVPAVVVAIVGGSVSASNAYGDFLAALRSDVEVVNRAVGATGIATASFWLDSMLAGAPSPDVMVIEFAGNEALTWDAPSSYDQGPGPAPSSANGGEAVVVPHATRQDWRRFGSHASLERLLRRLRRELPRTTPVLLNVCGPGEGGEKSARLSSCEHVFTAVARRYGVHTISMRRGMDAAAWADSFRHDPKGHHPDMAGQKAIARLLAEAMEKGLPRPSARTPAASFMDADWEAADSSWECDSAFTVLAGAAAPRHGSMHSGSTRFVVSSEARILLAPAVSTARHLVLATECGCGHGDGPDGRAQLVYGGRARRAVQLDVCWDKPAHHVCFADLGGVPPHTSVQLLAPKGFVLNRLCSQTHLPTGRGVSGAAGREPQQARTRRPGAAGVVGSALP